MLRMTAISAGMGGVNYLLRASGCAEHDHAQHSRETSSTGAEYLLGGSEVGEPDGVWAGRGLEMLGLTPGQQVTAEQMRAVYGRLEHPTETDADGNAVPLGRRPRKFASQADRLADALAAEPHASEERQEQIRRDVQASQRKAVGYYDLTFSPVKSVSVYRAALEADGQHELAAKITEAHNRAAREALEYLENQVTTTRVGRHTTVTREDGTKTTIGEYARIKGLVTTLWEHSSSREGDPHLHTHAGVLNRVMTVDGKIYALDGQQFKPLKGAADVIYERRMEELITQATGARFAWRPDGKTREILGVDRVLCDESSGRRAAIDKRLAALVESYRAEHGHDPGRQAMAAMRREAWANTRKAKTMESPAALAERYAHRHGEQLLKDQVRNVAEAAARVEAEGLPGGQPTFATEDELIAEAVRRTQATHATWDETALALEMNKVLGEVHWGAAAPAEIDRLVARAVAPDGPADVIPLAGAQRVRVPDALREGGVAEGQPIYRAASSLQYATRDQIAAEKALVAEATLRSGPQLEAEKVAATIAELDAAGLSPDQRNAVIGVLSSGRAADTLIGPAGTGKSTTIGKLDQLWRQEFNAPVLGLATSQRATDVLEGEGLEALNTAMFLAKYMPEDGSTPQAKLAPGTMIVVDEAGMADTDKLARIAKLVRAADGKLLYTGDHHQLAAVGTGGLLDLMARDAQPFELSQVWRFRNQWEQEASLAFRVGDQAALTAYEQHGRLRGGTKAEMAEAAVRGYMADVMDGRDSVLVVKTNQDAAELSGRVRQELIDLGRVSDEDLAELSDRNMCSVGDVIQARLNDHNPAAENGRMLVNRELLTVLGTDERGRLRVERQSDGTKVWLSPEYVEEHASLAYAGTVHSVQGRTTDTSHSLVERGMSRNSVYVEGTRGRDANYFYGVTEVAPDEHDLEDYSVSTTDVLREVLANDGAQVSATETYRAALQSSDSLAEIGLLWSLVARDAMATRHHAILREHFGPDRLEAMTQEDGHEQLMTTLAHAEMSGQDVERLIISAMRRDEAKNRTLDDAASMSGALRWRVRNLIETGGDRPVPPTWKKRLRASNGNTVSDYAAELGEVMDARVEIMERAAVLAPPEWALVDLGPMPETDHARSVWAARVGAVGAYREMYGLDPDTSGIGAAPSREQDPVRHVAWHRAWEALGQPQEQADHQTLPVEELRGQIGRWEREQEWAPVYVAQKLEETVTLTEEFRRESLSRWAQAEAEVDQLGDRLPAQVHELRDAAGRAFETSEYYLQRAAQARRDGQQETAEACTGMAAEFQARAVELRQELHAETAGLGLDDAAEACSLMERAERADRLGAEFGESAERYERLATARERWAEHTAELADQAALAAAELERRGEPLVEEVEQLALLDERGRDTTEYAREASAEYDEAALEGELLPLDEQDQAAAEPAVEVVDAELVEDTAGPAAEAAQEPQTLFDAETGDDATADHEPGADEAIEGELLPADAEQDQAERPEPELDIFDAEVVDDVTWDELEEREAAQQAKVERDQGHVEPEKEKGDYGTRYRLDEIPEVDAERAPAPAEVDEAQEQLFPVEAELSDRVSQAKVRSDVDLTIGDAEVRAELVVQTIAGRELRDGWDDDRADAAEEERRRADRDRVDREAKQEREQRQLRDHAAQQDRDHQPELHL